MIRWPLSISCAVQGRAEGQSPGLDTGPSRLRIERSTPKTYPVGPVQIDFGDFCFGSKLTGLAGVTARQMNPR
jgi:hypothetical protein